MFVFQEQRRQLLVKQQEQRLQMFEAQRRDAIVAGTPQQQQPTTSHRSPSYNTGPGLRAMLSESAQEGTSRQTGNIWRLTLRINEMSDVRAVVMENWPIISEGL